MRTQDLNRYEHLARELSFAHPLDPSETQAVLQATGHTWADLQRRARFLQDRRSQVAQPIPPSDLERYQDEARLWGVDEGLAIVVGPMLLLTAVTVGLIALMFL